MAFRGQRTILTGSRPVFGGTPPIADTPYTSYAPAQSETSLPEVVRETYPVLYETSTIFPFVFFPSRIIVRLNHIDIVQGIFFLSETHIRLQIPDIHQVIVSYVPFFATLEVVPRGPMEQSQKLSYLPPLAALRAKRIIAGLVECYQKKVDFSRYSLDELAGSMEDIGRATE